LDVAALQPLVRLLLVLETVQSQILIH